MDVGAEVELTLDGIAHGGDAVGRLPDGRVCFVPYALPGERVRVRVTRQRKRYARAHLLAVLEPSPARVAPPCPYFGPGRCGGCQLQHAAPEAQAALKQRVLREQLQRIGGVADPPVAPPLTVSPTAYRSTARFAVDPTGRLGFRRAGSHDVQPVDRCLLLDEATQRLRERIGDRWQGTREVVVRTGGGLGAGAVVSADGAIVAGSEPVVISVGDVDLQVSAGSFFQTGPQGAALLLRLVRDAAAVRPGDVVLELFAGVGLFTCGLAADGGVVTAVESSDSAVRDLTVNVSETDVQVVHGDAGRAVTAIRAEGQQVDIVVLDPPRRGAGPGLCADIAGLGARRLVYVSCDPAALARDTGVLANAGYQLAHVQPVDQFPQTAAIEAVATFDRAAAC